MVAEHISRIQVFMTNFQDVMEQFSSMKEKLTAQLIEPHWSTVPGQDPAKLTLAERVLLIIRQLNRPVWPKVVAMDYETRNWPKPRSGTVYDAVNGAMSYLLHRRNLLTRNNEGYFLAPETLSDRKGGEKTGEGTRA